MADGFYSSVVEHVGGSYMEVCRHPKSRSAIAKRPNCAPTLHTVTRPRSTYHPLMGVFKPWSLTEKWSSQKWSFLASFAAQV